MQITWYVDGKYGQVGENLGGDWKIWEFGGKWTDIYMRMLRKTWVAGGKK